MWSAVIGVLGTLAGTALGSWLVGRSAAQQWQREQAARHRDRVVELVEELLIASSGAAVAFGRVDRAGQAPAVLEVARCTRILVAHAGKVDPDLARIIRQAEERFRRARTAKENAEALTSLTVLAELWLTDAGELVGKDLSDFEASA